MVTQHHRKHQNDKELRNNMHALHNYEIDCHFHVRWLSPSLVSLSLTGINLTVLSRVAIITHTGPIATVGVGAVPVQAITVCTIQTDPLSKQLRRLLYTAKTTTQSSV